MSAARPWRRPWPWEPCPAPRCGPEELPLELLSVGRDGGGKAWRSGLDATAAEILHLEVDFELLENAQQPDVELTEEGVLGGQLSGHDQLEENHGLKQSRTWLT